MKLDLKFGSEDYNNSILQIIRLYKYFPFEWIVSEQRLADSYFWKSNPSDIVMTVITFNLHFFYFFQDQTSNIGGYLVCCNDLPSLIWLLLLLMFVSAQKMILIM